MPSLFAVFGLGPVSVVIIGLLAVLLFGERLPEIAKTVGKWFTTIKKEVHGFEREIRGAINDVDSPTASTDYAEPEDRDEATAPKFEPPPPT
ncbi:MAG: twin-arginine translocase TatA/TatE family subunit [Pirellulales bacterium]|nr:twin-arginine translocase TatA/TatE family subunit [Pirellulales bacterium]